MTRSKPYIHIIDDDLSFGRSLLRLLNFQGYAAAYYPSADAFLSALPPCSIQGMAIVDLNMPQCDGVALMDRLRSLGCAIPVILITGKPQAHTRNLAQQKGAIGYLEKPFSVPMLIQLIEQHEPCFGGMG